MLCLTTSSHITTAPLHIAAAVNRYGGDGGGRGRDVKYVVYLLSRLELGTRGASQSVCIPGGASERARASIAVVMLSAHIPNRGDRARAMSFVLSISSTTSVSFRMFERMRELGAFAAGNP